MNKRNLLILFVCVNILLLSSCGGIRGITVSEEQKADERMKQIISAIQTEDKNNLIPLFSKNAIEESDNFDCEMDLLFSFIQGDIDSWERVSWASDESINNGKKSLMIRSDYKIITNEEEYSFFIIDYSVDTIDPDNEGIYMLQVSTNSYNVDLGSWQERLRAGLFIPEE